MESQTGPGSREAIVLVPGFGDNRTLFEPLRATALGRAFRLLPIDLPGFGAPPLKGETTLERLAEVVDDFARREGARIVLAHSVASVIASLAAQRPGSPIDTILSHEGNLTADDAYFSGTAADFDDPQVFHAAFLQRLDRLAEDTPVVARYRAAVALADPDALWQLGKDARRFSDAHVPGECLMQARSVVYLYNPDNMSAATLAWLERVELKPIRLDGATHWTSVDQPDLLAAKLLEALRGE